MLGIPIRLPGRTSSILMFVLFFGVICPQHADAPLAASSTAITGQAPTVPTNPNPEDGMINVFRKLALRWTCSDPDSPQLQYDVYFGTSSPPPLVGTVQLLSYEPQGPYPFGALEPSRLYYWQIVARDPENNTTAGPIWSFTTSAPTPPPQTPYDPLPATNATNMPLSLTLRWSSGDPEGLSYYRYDVYFGTSPNPPKVATNIVKRSYFVGGLVQTTDYYWRIVARDIDDYESSGPTWTFRTAVNPNNNITLGLYADALGTLCALNDAGAGVRTVYVVLDGPTATTGCRFAAPIPTCFGATWLADNTEYTHIGTSPQDVLVAFGICLTPPIQVMSISYLSNGGTQGCCSLPLTGTAVSGLQITDCSFTQRDVRNYPVLGISSDGRCPSCTPVSVRKTTWGSIKALYR